MPTLRRPYLHLYVFIFTIFFTGGICLAQNNNRSQLNSIVSTLNTTTEKLGIEKLYLHTDKPAYQTGDTLWFKAYLLEASTLNSSSKSGLLYLELSTDSNRLIKRIMVPVYRGLTLGHIVLNTDDVPQGGYILRAYTNWMRNFNEESVYQKHFFVSGAPVTDSWLLNYNVNTSRLNQKDNVRLKLKVSQVDKNPVMVREMQLSITDGNRNLLRSNIQTDVAGEMDFNFNLPDKATGKALTVNLKDMRQGAGNRVMKMPLVLHREKNIDIQFMPEGGNLVAGLSANIAFKAVNEDGLSTNVSGKIYDSKNNEVSAFTTLHKGMGTFNLTPVAAEVYTARIKLPDGTEKSFQLPTVLAKGITLKVENPFSTDSCKITIAGSHDTLITGRSYYLMAISRGVVCYAAAFKLMGGATRVSLSKNLFPTGITRFLLIDDKKTVLNERMVYIDHADNLNIRVASHKPAYARRDSVNLNLTVTDKSGRPVMGTFSLAVTDDGQLQIDSLAYSRINTHFHLNSNLQGNIEDPGYYSNPHSDVKKWAHTNLLMLVHGWVGYSWGDYFKPGQDLSFQPEPEFAIKGKVVNMFNKPVSNSGITLFSQKPLFVTDTVSNSKGIFTFHNITPSDTAVYFLQARNKRGKSNNVGIEVEQFKPPVFKAPANRLVPWYVNIDTAKLEIINKQIQLKNEQERVTRGNLLKAVEVKGIKAVKGSKNLNGPGGADIVLDEEELQKAGKTTLRALIDQRVKGFQLYIGFNKRIKDSPPIQEYRISGRSMHLIIDGIELDWFYDAGQMFRGKFYDQYLDFFTADDIKGIEIMTSSQYTTSYFSNYMPNKSFDENHNDHSFLEVTTRSGAGPFISKSVGTYVYRPMPFALAKAFYSPKYKPNAIPNMADIRSTIFWTPSIETDKDGKASVSFYTADNAGSYTIQVEGADLQGNVGAKTSSIKVNQ